MSLKIMVKQKDKCVPTTLHWGLELQACLCVGYAAWPG